MYANYVKYYAQKNYAIMYIMQCNYVDADLFSPLDFAASKRNHHCNFDLKEK